MKVIQILVIGDKSVGKSTLIDTFLWKLHSGYAYHDHRVEKRRYEIQVSEVAETEDLQNIINQKNYEFIIYLICFNIANAKTLEGARTKWLLECRKCDPLAEMILLGLQCDLREQLAYKLWHKVLSRDEVVNICRYYHNLHYLEGCALKADNVKDIFERTLHLVLYNERKMKKGGVKLNNLNYMKYKFDKSGNVV